MEISHGCCASCGMPVLAALTSTLLLVVSMATGHWENHSYNFTCVISKNTSGSAVITKYSDFFMLAVPNNISFEYIPVGTSMQDLEDRSLIYHLHDQHAGIWTLCNILSDQSQRFIYGNNHQRKCFDYISEYPSIKPSLSANAIHYIQMRNFAISNLILDMLMLTAAIVVAGVGFVTGQTICILVTAVMFILTGVVAQHLTCVGSGFCWRCGGGYDFYSDCAFYTSIALTVMHVKMAKEMSTCSSITGIPLMMCDCRTIEADWSLYTAWVAVVMFVISFFMWLHLTKVTLQNASKPLSRYIYDLNK